MNHLCKRVLSASLSLVLVGSLSYGTAGAAFRQDIPSIKGAYTTGAVELTPEMIAAKAKGATLYVALYTGQKMTSLQALTPDANNQITLPLSTSDNTYQIFCLNTLNNMWAPADISNRNLYLSMVYGQLHNHSVGYSYDVHNDLGVMAYRFMEQNGTLLSKGIQEFLQSLQNAGYLDNQGKILSDGTFDRGKFLADNWSKLFDRFEGYVSADDQSYKNFKALLSFDSFVTTTVNETGTTYSLRYTGDSFSITNCANYLTPQFKALVLAGYDVMHKSAPKAGVTGEEALINRIAGILQSRLDGVTASASTSIQKDGNNTPVTLTESNFKALGKLLRQHDNVEVLSVLETLHADRLEINKTVDAATLTKEVIRLIDSTNEDFNDQVTKLFSKIPSRTLQVVLDFDTALPAPQ